MATEDVTRLPLCRRNGLIIAHALINASDFAWLSEWTWRFDGNGYASRGVRYGHRGLYERIFIHRLLLGLSYGDPREGDHINRDRLDCRRSNLRILAKGQNGQNVTGLRDATSVYRGVFWNPDRHKWTAKVGRAYLGLFEREEEAAAAARAYRMEHMPFAHD